MLDNINSNINAGRARITAHCGKQERKAALRGAAYVVNAIQVGRYKPSTVIDFKIPNKYGLRQTIADTLGIGGIFRALRTVPILQDFARNMEQVCPNAVFLNYTNPMSMLTGALLRMGVKTVGLCHSVQVCADCLLMEVGLQKNIKKLQWKVAGINHQGWLLEITDGGRDLYPEIKKRAAAAITRVMKHGGARKYAHALLEQCKKQGADIQKTPLAADYCVTQNMIRLEIMLRFGYYLTESSEHSAEYMPYWIKRAYPELIDRYNIPLDEYPRRCVNQIKNWKHQRDELVKNKQLTHQRSHEYGSRIMDAMETDVPARIGGNVMNTGLIPNLPPNACVEVPCLVDRNGVQGCFVGNLPEQCAALNRTIINVQLLTLEAAFKLRKDYIYQAALMDPHTSSELSIDEIVALCNDLIKAHGGYLPKYK
jgi:alpha-galactosidase